MDEKSNDIALMAASLANNPEVAAEVKKAMCFNSVVSQLLAMRVKKGLTQEDIAAHMKCSPSKVSRMESGNDLNLRWFDLVRYLMALNMKMCFSFEDPTLPASERIKHNVFRIHQGLEQLVSLARKTDGDEEMAKKINTFYGEVLLNFLARYQESASKLQNVTGFGVAMPDMVIPEDESEDSGSEAESHCS